MSVSILPISSVCSLLGTGKTEQKSKRTHDRGQECGYCRGVGGWVEVEEGGREINGNGINVIKINFKKLLKNNNQSVKECLNGFCSK